MEAHLFHNLILFGRILRGVGIDATPGRMQEVMRALRHIDVTKRGDFFLTCRTLLVKRKADYEKFSAAFDAFWQDPDSWQPDPRQGSVKQLPKQAQPIVIPPMLQKASAEEDDERDLPELDAPAIELTQTWSKQEVLRHKDFSELTTIEEAEIKQLIARMTWQLGWRQTRRFEPGKGRTPDFRRTLRHSLRNGGEILQLKQKRYKKRLRPLIVLADISGSMERYTKLLLHLLYSLTAGLDQRVETFVFGTRLTRITKQLQHKKIDQALAEVSHEVLDWSGGTRIGDSLKTFNYSWSRRVLGQGAVVLLISDGWDRGEPKLLNKEMARLNLSCSRLIWLNPLLGSPEYEPLTRGMQAAMPHIDDFMPVHNLAALDELAEHLSLL